MRLGNVPSPSAITNLRRWISGSATWALSPLHWRSADKPSLYSDVVQDVNHTTHRVMENFTRFPTDLLVLHEKACIRTDTDRIEIDSGLTGWGEHCWVGTSICGTVCWKSEGEWRVQERLSVCLCSCLTVFAQLRVLHFNLACTPE